MFMGVTSLLKLVTIFQIYYHG